MILVSRVVCFLVTLAMKMDIIFLRFFIFYFRVVEEFVIAIVSLRVEYLRMFMEEVL